MRPELKKMLAALAAPLCCISFSHAQSQAVSVATELEALYHIGQLPAYRTGTQMLQASSYDRTGGNDDGFSGRYSYVRRQPDSSLVLLDAQGPGVVNRIWTPTPTTDSLDFFIDDTTRPAFTLAYLDLFSGKVPPFVAPLSNNQLGGYYCYLPIPFQSRCRIVLRAKNTQFYQIGYRSFPAGTRVQSFRLPLDAAAQAAVQKVSAYWNNPAQALQGTAGLQTITKSITLQPGGRQAVWESARAGRITGIELEPADLFAGDDRNIDIRITWDGEQVPAVYCPVSDFFGYAFGQPSMQSLLLGTRGRTAYCYLPMPFDRSAKVELLHRKTGNATGSRNITARIYFQPQPRRQAQEGKLYTWWNHRPQLPLGQPHLLLQALGKGHLAATVLQSRGLTPGMTGFFEGDDSTVADGRMTMHGTGSEDYFNGGWYAMMDRWDGPFSLPLSGALDYNLPLSRTGGYRLFLSDKIPFEQSFHHSIEHGGERNDAPATYTSVAYYYGDRPPASATPPTVLDTRVTHPDTLFVYPQLLTMNTTAELGIRRLWAYNTGGESILFTTPGESGIRVHLEAVPEGAYQVYLDYVRFPQGASFSVWQRQTPLTGWMESSATDTARVERQYLSDLTVTPLSRTLTLRIRTAGNRNQFFLNRIMLVRRK